MIIELNFPIYTIYYGDDFPTQIPMVFSEKAPRYVIQIAWTSRPSESPLIQLFWENDAAARSLLPSTFLSVRRE